MRLEELKVYYVEKDDEWRISVKGDGYCGELPLGLGTSVPYLLAKAALVVERLEADELPTDITKLIENSDNFVRGETDDTKKILLV